MDTKGGKWGWDGGDGGMNWEIGIDMYTPICIKQITNKNLLYKKKIKQNSKKYPKNKSYGAERSRLRMCYGIWLNTWKISQVLIFV